MREKITKKFQNEAATEKDLEKVKGSENFPNAPYTQLNTI